MAKLLVLGIGTTALGLVFYFFWWLGKRHLSKGKKYLQQLADTFDLTLDLKNAPKSSFFQMHWEAFQNVVGGCTVRGSYYTTNKKRGNTQFYHTAIDIYSVNPNRRALTITPKERSDSKKAYQSIGHPELDALYVFETNDLAFFKHHLIQPKPLSWLLDAPLTIEYWSLSATDPIVGPPGAHMMGTHRDFILHEKTLASYETTINLGVYFGQLFRATYEAQKAASSE